MGNDITKRISAAEARLAEFEAEMKTAEASAESARSEIARKIRADACGGDGYSDAAHEKDRAGLLSLEAKISKCSSAIAAIQDKLSSLSVEKGREDLEAACRKIEELHAEAIQKAKSLMAATSTTARALEGLRRCEEEVEKIIMDEIRPGFYAAKPGVNLPPDFTGQTGLSWIGLLARYPDLPQIEQDPVDRLALKGWIRHGDIRRPLNGLLG